MPLRSVTPELSDRWRALGIWGNDPLHRAVDETAIASPDRLAVADQSDRYTYAELVSYSSALARWLLDQGLKPGTAVAVQAGNRVVVPLAHLACNRANLTFVPLSSAWRRTEIRHLLRTSGAAVVIVPPARLDFDFLAMVQDMRDDLPELKLVGTTGGPGGDFALRDVISGGTRETFSVDQDPDDARFAMVTSGTTELPRMSLWTDNNLRFFLTEFGRAVGMREGDIAVGVAPANTGSTGYVFPVLAPLLHGASSVLLEHWSPREALELLERERATIATAVPTQLIKMLQEETIGDRDYDALRVFNNGGAPLPAQAAREVESVFGCTIQTVYGASDGGVPVMTRIGDPPEKRWTTVGRTLPETELRLVDIGMSDVPSGQAGEVLWRNPVKTHGYFNEPERTEAMFWDDGYYRSGDLGVVDEDGYLRIVGRVKDLIIRGGQNISPREIEELIASAPSVSEVAVVGIPDPVYGERTCACVVLRPGQRLAFDELIQFLEEHEMAKYKLPERLEIFNDLPKSAGAKVSKVELRAAVVERLEREAGPI